MLLKYKYQTVLVTLVIVLIHFSRMILQTLQHYSLNNRALKSPVHSLTLGLSVTLFYSQDLPKSSTRLQESSRRQSFGYFPIEEINM